MLNRRFGSGLLAAIALASASVAAAPSQHRFLFLGHNSGSAYSGAEQGIREANIQGQFLGQSFVLTRMRAETAALPKDTIAILVSEKAPALHRLSRDFADLPIFNLVEDDDALRDECMNHVLHVLPSRRMKNDARAQWRIKNPRSDAKANAWHHSFKKYAAAQLNQRYHGASQRNMDDAAWAGWAAVKMTSDMIARTQLRDPEKLLRALRTELAFDGQKGAALSFRENGQLRQPLLLVDGARVVGEAPVRGVAQAGDLDSLGAVSCAK